MHASDGDDDNDDGGDVDDYDDDDDNDDDGDDDDEKRWTFQKSPLPTPHSRRVENGPKQE